MISMKPRMKTLLTLCFAVPFTMSHAIAAPAAVVENANTAASRTMASALPAVPIVNWTVPQFFGGPSGVVSSMATSFAADASKVNVKSIDLGLTVFRPINPCRLVDTRGLFNPVYGGGAFSAGETRTYHTLGNCGLPNLTNRIKAVSLAITKSTSALRWKATFVSTMSASLRTRRVITSFIVVGAALA